MTRLNFNDDLTAVLTKIYPISIQKAGQLADLFLNRYLLGLLFYCKSIFNQRSVKSIEVINY